MVVGAPEQEFFEKKMMSNMAKKDEKTMLFRLLRKSSHYFCLEFVKNESSYGPLKFCENCMPEKNLVLKWWPKMALGQ